MSNFSKFKQAIQKQFKNMSTSALFQTEVDKQELWETYLESFPEGTNPLFRERREYDCNCCKNFIRQYGNIVSLSNGVMTSIWDVSVEYPFNVIAEALSKKVKAYKINNIFFTDSKNAGNNITRTLKENDVVEEWEHFYLHIPDTFVKRKDTIDTLKGNYRASKDVYMRSMEELTLEAGETILELISQGTLYRGEEHKVNVSKFISDKNNFSKVKNSQKDNWCWERSINNPIARIRNTAIGTLLIDISNNEDLDIAVTKFEKVMAPTNYKRPKAIITKQMVETAEKTIRDLGLSEALGRRYALLEDVSVNNVLFVDRDAKKKLYGNVFDDLKDTISDSSKTLSKIEEVSIDDFIENILPHTKNLELLVENKHIGNLMTLVAPTDATAPSILQWDNNFSWSYKGNVADSIKQNVKNAGGAVDGVLRFSIQWNDKGDNQNDFDAHCIEPSGNEIFYCSKCNRRTGGTLDVDIINPNEKVAVENITWQNKSCMEEGVYIFSVHNYNHRGGTSGFSAEIEYEGEIYSFEYPHELKAKENVIVARIQFSKKNGIKFIHSLDSTKSSKEVWNVKTNKFAKVSVCMLSPNYWDEQKGNGNKHYFFFLEDCKNDEIPRGFYNEFLKTDLVQHKRVFEALASKMKLKYSDNQLSGLGFSSTMRNEIIAKVDGSFKRTIKIKF